MVISSKVGWMTPKEENADRSDSDKFLQMVMRLCLAISTRVQVDASHCSCLESIWNQLVTFSKCAWCHQGIC